MEKLNGRCGEHLVCAELLRRDIIATTFSGNMPDFDILTFHYKIQVKTTKEKGKKDETWPMDARNFLIFDEDLYDKVGKQKIIGKKKLDLFLSF
jgi:hypothetical protein